jgi:holo-[acyl-carrier protein] synthase
MIKGIGVDIIEIERIRENIESLGDQFLEKIFTPLEIAYCSEKANRAQHFAARFAAKEAVSKALSTGWAGEFRWKDAELTNDSTGQPHITLYGSLRTALAGDSIFVSISHSHSHVVAMVVIERGPV